MFGDFYGAKPFPGLLLATTVGIGLFPREIFWENRGRQMQTGGLSPCEQRIEENGYRVLFQAATLTLQVRFNPVTVARLGSNRNG